MKHELPPVDVWRLISDGIEGPLRGGFRRGIKHSDLDITDEEIERIIEAQNDYIMIWFSETFFFPGPSEGDGE